MEGEAEDANLIAMTTKPTVCINIGVPVDRIEKVARSHEHTVSCLLVLRSVALGMTCTQCETLSR